MNGVDGRGDITGMLCADEGMLNLSSVYHELECTSLSAELASYPPSMQSHVSLTSEEKDKSRRRLAPEYADEGGIYEVSKTYDFMYASLTSILLGQKPRDPSETTLLLLFKCKGHITLQTSN